MKIEVTRSHQALRKVAYPPIEEQLDALWKGGADADAMRQRVLAVKAKYPEPKQGKPHEPTR